MVLTRRTLMTLAAGAVLANAMPASGGDSIRLSGRAFGTSWHLRLRGTGDLDVLSADLVAVLGRIDSSMSPFRADSSITGFNASGAGRHEVDPDLAAVAAQALRIAVITAGAFDPSVGPDVGRYGFGPIQGERVGTYAGLAVDGSVITKTDGRLTLDLCGIAKGYALDLVADRVAAAGFHDFVSEIGGEVLARGIGDNGLPWRIGISDPLGSGLHTIVDAKGLALATSGDAVNAYTVAGRRYSHVIDPRTDEPIVNRVASVSVFADTAMTADALATALLVMGLETGLAFAEAQEIPALFLMRGQRGLAEFASTNYHKHSLS